MLKDKLAVIGNGVVINPPALLKELHYLQDNGIDISGLRISSRSHITFPYPFFLISVKKRQRVITRWVQPRMGSALPTWIRFHGLVSGCATCSKRTPLKKSLNVTWLKKNELFTKLYHVDPINFDDIFESYYEYGQELKQYVTDTAQIVNDALDQDKKVLFEGAQGVMLDVDQGTYPYVTASNPIRGEYVLVLALVLTRLKPLLEFARLTLHGLVLVHSQPN